MSLNPSEISELIKSRIESLDDTAEIHNQGTIVSVSDGICRIRGLSNAMQGEMLEFPGNTYGLALNLERHFVGAVILGGILSDVQVVFLKFPLVRNCWDVSSTHWDVQSMGKVPSTPN